jgi:hypothetical protein
MASITRIESPILFAFCNVATSDLRREGAKTIAKFLEERKT